MKRLLSLWLAALFLLTSTTAQAVVCIGFGQSATPSGIDLTLESSVVTHDYRSTTTLTKPANTVDGDFLLATIHLDIYQSAPTPPSGWTLIASKVHSESDRGAIWVYYKRAASEGASWAWTHTYDITGGAVKRITGVVSTGEPEDVAESTCELAYSVSAMSCASITTATSGSAVVMISGTTTIGTTWASHMLTQRVESTGGTYVLETTVDGDIQASAGASGAKTVTPSDYARSVGVLIALKPQ